MAEVMKLIEVSDLNGVSLNPQDLSVDQLVAFTGFIRGLTSSLGTAERNRIESIIKQIVG